MSRNRVRRSRSRQRRRTRRTEAGVSAGSADQSTSRISTAASVSDTVSPSNALRPESISYRTAPNAQMSARLSTDLPRACSGDMYAAVPMTTPALVAAAVSVGECVWSGDDRSPGQRLRQAEVEHLDLALRRELHVGGLQVPVHDPLLVRGLERVRDLARDRERLVDRHRAGRDPLRQRLALDELEHERLDVAGLLQPVDRRDVRVVQRRQDLRLALEPRQPLRVLRHRLRQHLDRDVAVELRVPRPVHLSHPARAERRRGSRRDRASFRQTASSAFELRAGEGVQSDDDLRATVGLERLDEQEAAPVGGDGPTPVGEQVRRGELEELAGR